MVVGDFTLLRGKLSTGGDAYRGDRDRAHCPVPAFAIKWLVPRMEAFFAAHPDIHLHLVRTALSQQFSLPAA